MALRNDRLYQFGPFLLSPRDHTVWREGALVGIGPQAVRVLEILLEANGHFVTQDDLWTKAWPPNAEAIEESNVRVKIVEIREALGDNKKPHRFIQTGLRRGYRLIPRVTEVEGRESDTSAPPPSLPRRPPTEPSEPSRAPEPDPLPVKRRSRVLPISVVAAGLLISAALGLNLSRNPAAIGFGKSMAVTADGMAKNNSLLTVRNNRVYYASLADPTRAFWVPLSGGGDPMPVSDVSANFMLVDVHPIRSEYLGLKRGSLSEVAPETTDKELWTFSKTSEPPRRVGDLRCHSAAWSRDGTRIVCARETPQPQLIVANSDGSGARAIVALPSGSAQEPRWSPDDSLIRFSRAVPVAGEPSRFDLWEVRPDGSGLRPLFPGETNAPNRRCGDWTPDSRHYIYDAEEDGISRLWALSEHRSLLGRSTRQVTRLTTDPTSFICPRVAPDGSVVVALGVNRKGDLVKFDRQRNNLVLFMPEISGTWVSFSPDKESIAFIGQPDKRLWRARLDGSDRRALTDGPFEADGSVWSPDGKSIAFLSRASGSNLRVHLIPADGGRAFPITPDDRRQGIPSWSDDSGRLVFGDVPAGFGSPDGGERLTTYDLQARKTSTIPGSEGLWTARYSHDGRFIAAVKVYGRTLHIYDVARNQWRGLPVDHVENPTWSADDRYIYFMTEGGISRLRRVRVIDGVVEDLLDLERVPLAAYWWFSLAPDDSPMFLRRLGLPQIYSFKIETR